ncbi:transposase [Bacillus sp. DX1.1]|uniref:transposase n=1 Tax=unclassified Bacillus (in: firmicutes) TaxID=185979 RepID=UPI002570EABC|nr:MULTISPECIES: transposase [unclassified Bacillus (in: firmicutes)]MDM5154342.1 transposase [Bacillus sp. DX1.1]WJE84036.1 transposase [Bacillus sp. DX3.1]
MQQWFDSFTFGPSAVMRKIAKTLLSRKEAFLACAIHPYSNGITEGTNNKIKLLKRRDYGYRNMERFKLRIRLETGSLFKHVNYNLW